MKNINVESSQQQPQRNVQQRRTYQVEVMEGEETTKVQEVKSQKTQTRAKEDEQAEKPKPRPQSQPPIPARSSTPPWEQQHWWQRSSQGRVEPWSWSGSRNCSEGGWQKKGKSKGQGKGKGDTAPANAGKGGRGKGNGQEREPCHYGDNCRFKSKCRYTHRGDAQQGKGKGKGRTHRSTPTSSGWSSSQ